MASRINRPNGHRWVQFKGSSGARQTLRLGKMSAGDADEIKRRVELLLSAQTLGCLPDQETSRWITMLPPTLAAKLAAVGLIEKRLASNLGELVAYTEKHLACRSVTALNEHRYTRQHLTEFFSADRQLHTITAAEAKQFYAWMQQTLAQSTAGKRCEKAKSYFSTAVDNNWLRENPFDGISTTVKAPRDRDATIDEATSKRILDEIADPKFRLIFALARYAGLRTPSEVNALEWQHVRWDDNQLHVWSPKTEDQRTLPIFSEIRPYLDVVWEQAAEGESRVLGDWEPTNAALTSRLKKVLKRLGVDLWPKPWQNLRPTRENELLEVFPQHVVCEWMGYTRDVAREHYYRVAKEHYDRASQPEGSRPTVVF